jgi:hypothetical protein
MINLIKWAIVALSLLLLVIPFGIIKKINLKNRKDRWKQLRFVYTSLLFGIIACSLFGLLNTLLDKLFRLNAIQGFLSQVVPPAIFEYIIDLFAAILLNAGLLIVFCIIKRLDKIGMKNRTLPKDWNELLKTKRPLLKYWYWAVLNTIYRLDDKSFLLRINLVKAKKTLKYFVRVIAALFMLEVVLLEVPLLYLADWIPFDLMSKILNVTYLWPAVSMIIACEVFYYLDGEEEFEDGGSFIKEHAPKSSITDYSKLEGIYKETFKGRYITTLNPKDHAGKTRTDDMDKGNPIVEGIKAGLKGKFEINPNYIKHIESIVDGKSVIIDTSVYSEFGEYLFRYLNMVLARGETVLVICPDEHEMGELRKYSEERLALINGYHYLWQTEEYKNNLGANDRDILFATPQIVANDIAFKRRFFDLLSTVIVANATETMARDNLQLSLLSFKLNSLKNGGTPVRYICLAESIPLGIRKSLVESLRLPEALSVGDTYSVRDNTKIILWRYEDPNAPFAQDKLFSSRSQRYLGFALPIACVALKNDVDMVSILSHMGTPHVQMLDNLNSIRHLFNEFFENRIVEFDRQIVFNRYNRENQYARFGVMDDELCNLPMVIYNGARLGGKDTTMIHIISKAYMLRDFFFANAENYLHSESSINMFMPSVADTSKLAVFRLLYDMQKNGLSEDDVIDRVERLQPSGRSLRSSDSPIRAALAYCIKKATGSDMGDSVYRHFAFYKKTEFNEDNADFESYYLVKYRGRNVIDDLMGESRLATIHINGKTYTANFFSDGIYQRHLRGQYIVHNGRNYLITNIRNGQIELKASMDESRIPASYTQIRKYSVDNSAPRTSPVQGRSFEVTWNNMLEGFTVQAFKAPVEVKTLGYYVHTMAGDAFNYLIPTPVEGEQNHEMQKEAFRSYSAANILDLTIKCKIGADTDRVTFLLAVAMNEFFKTWFPYSKDCIAVCPVLKNPDVIYADELGKHISRLYPQMTISKKPEFSEASVELYIIEDSKTDLGIVQSLIDNWQEMFDRIFDNLQEYFNWQQTYDDKGDDNIHNKYLYFGKDGEPDCFDFGTLTKMLNETVRERRVDTADIDNLRVAVKNECSFCGEPIQSVQVNTLADGRIMCSRCAAAIVTDEDKLRELYAGAVGYLNSAFSATISDNIKVRFATADSIRLRMRTGEERIVLGFADPNSRELWVETDAPATNLSEVLVHELTHFWQFDNINCETAGLESVEGQSSYVEVQYMHHIGQTSWADHVETELEQRDDPYGRGFRRLKQELADRGDTNSFAYIRERFGEQTAV